MKRTTGLEGKITSEMIEDLLKEKGKEYPVRKQWNEEATRDTIRHWADGIGDLNPLWRDDEYAKKTRYGCVTAPPTFLLSVAILPGRMGMPGIHGLHAGAHFYFYQPIRVGCQIKASGGLYDLVEKTKSKWAGRTFLQTFFINYRDQQGELLAKLHSSAVRGERQAASEHRKYADIKVCAQTEEELKQVWEGIEQEERRGSNPQYWEDVVVGEKLTPVVKGPLIMSDMIAFKMGWGSHFTHHIWANEVRYDIYKRHPGAPVLNELNVPDAPERVHFARELPQRLGFPSFYDYGPNRIGWLGHMLTNWMGDDGFIKELDTATRLPNFEGDIQWCKGVVIKKYVDGGEHLVEIEIWAENQRHERTMPGRAVVVLPSRSLKGL